jgi:hypothetical protein
MTGSSLSPLYYSIAGCMMASCGFIDVILYVTTRRALVGTHTGAAQRRADTPSISFMEKIRSIFQKDKTRLQDDNYKLSSFDSSSMRRGREGPKAEQVMGMGMGWGGIVVERRVSMSQDTIPHDEKLDGLERIDSQRRLVSAPHRSLSQAELREAGDAKPSRGSWRGSVPSPSINGEPGSKTWDAVN